MVTAVVLVALAATLASVAALLSNARTRSLLKTVEGQQDEIEARLDHLVLGTPITGEPR